MTTTDEKVDEDALDIDGDKKLIEIQCVFIQYRPMYNRAMPRRRRYAACGHCNHGTGVHFSEKKEEYDYSRARETASN